MDIILEEFASKHNLNDRQIKLLKTHGKGHLRWFEYKKLDAQQPKADPQKVIDKAKPVLKTAGKALPVAGLVIAGGIFHTEEATHTRTNKLQKMT